MLINSFNIYVLSKLLKVCIDMYKYVYIYASVQPENSYTSTTTTTNIINNNFICYQNDSFCNTLWRVFFHTTRHAFFSIYAILFNSKTIHVFIACIDLRYIITKKKGDKKFPGLVMNFLFALLYLLFIDLKKKINYLKTDQYFVILDSSTVVSSPSMQGFGQLLWNRPANMYTNLEIIQYIGSMGCI